MSSGGVILLHEWWGLTRGIREIAARISEESGLMTLVPDLYRGKIAENKEKAEKFQVLELLDNLVLSFSVDTFCNCVFLLDIGLL